jgi:hypothetical protein
MVAEPTAGRSWPQETRVRAHVEKEYGCFLTALAGMRTRAYEELSAARIELDSLVGTPGAFVLPIYCRAIALLDSIRLLLEAAYGDEALALVRGLYLAEVDAFYLVGSEDPHTLEDYTDWETYERVMLAGQALGAGLAHAWVTAGRRTELAIRKHIAELEAALAERGIAVPAGFDRLPLAEAVRAFARVRFGGPRPRGWIAKKSWAEILSVVAPTEIRTFEPELEEADPARFAVTVEKRKSEHEFVWPLLSAEAHGSARVVAKRTRNWEVAGYPAQVPGTAGAAGSQFIRLRLLAKRLWNLDGDEPAWRADLRALSAHVSNSDHTLP